MFLNLLDKTYLAYDIEPEGNRISKQDYLQLDLEYKQGRCIIGNPPYGTKNNLTVAFYKKSLLLGDYIAFILPISQYNNDIKLYEFNLLYSENLGIRDYSDRKVHCCLNIYSRPTCNKLNKKPNYKLKDIEIKEAIKNQNPKRRKTITKDEFDYDLRVMAWGGGFGRINQLGCEVQYEGQFSRELCIKVNNLTYKEQVLQLLKDVKWEEIYPTVATPVLAQWQVYKYIKQQIPEIM